MVDNDADAVEDITFQFRFRTETRNQDTFLYNTGQITSLEDADWNVRQFYSVTRIDGPRRSGRAQVLAENLPSPPVNVGFRSIPDYASVATQAIRALPNGISVFAGQREEGFYVNLGIFDLLGVPPADNVVTDSLAGMNVHSIALELPISALTANGSRPAVATDANAVIGVWSTASRPSVTARNGAQEVHSGRYVQVSRLGQPLVNEVVIPRRLKDAFNSIPPTQDAVALPVVQDPEVPKLLAALFGVRSPAAPRADLVTIFLTGLPGLNQPPNVTPSEMLRLNVAIRPTPAPNPLGVIGGDVAGFPNGRRPGDDVTDIELRVAMGRLITLGLFGDPADAPSGDLDFTDGALVTAGDFDAGFPYLRAPLPGNLTE
jgi:hypothetical protein